MRRRKRRFDQLPDEDPAAGLLNLFDVWIAFAVAILLAMGAFGSAARGKSASAGAPADDPVSGKRVPMQHLERTGAQAEGDGHRLGVAYELSDGRIVYVPEAAKGP